MRTPRRFRLVLLSLVFLVLLPAAVLAQVPAFVSMWGSHGSGDGQFMTAAGVAVGPGGEVFVVDAELARVQAFGPDGNWLADWNLPVGSKSAGVAANTYGDVYVAEPIYCSVARFTSRGGFIQSWLVTGGGAPGGYAFANALAVTPEGDLLVASLLEHHVKKYARTGGPPVDWSLMGPGYRNIVPLDLACDSQGNFFAVEKDQYRVAKFSPTGAFLLEWGGQGAGAGLFGNPVRIAVGPDEVVYVVDDLVSRVEMFTTSGAFIGQWGVPGSGVGQFQKPKGIAVGADGSVYVVDSGNSRIQRFGTVATPAEPASWGRLKTLYR